MPPRPKILLTAERRAALAAELTMYGQREERARLDKYVHVSRAFDAGMTLRDIAAVYCVSSGSIATWKELGEKERDRRRSGDPDELGEREPNG